MIPEGPAARRVIAMDYNLFVRHSGGFERPDDDARLRGPRLRRPSRRPSTRNMRGERMPLQLGFHFTLMNDGAYWKALERFAGDVCIEAGRRLHQLRRLSRAAPAPRTAPSQAAGG